VQAKSFLSAMKENGDSGETVTRRKVYTLSHLHTLTPIKTVTRSQADYGFVPNAMRSTALPLKM
jgi:hypothetical protein